MSSDTPEGWHPDPSGRHEYRFWDGAQWTEHVADGGVQTTDLDGMRPPDGAAVSAAPGDPPASPEKRGVFDAIDGTFTFGEASEREKISHQVRGDSRYSSAKVSGEAFAGQGTIFSEPILVVNQKAKLLELKQEYGVFDQHGNRIASVTQVGQSTMRKALRFLTDLDQFFKTRLEITDPSGTVLLTLQRPGKVFKSTVIVSDAAGNEIGRIVQKNMIGKIRFALEARGHQVGMIKAENWRAWNFRIEDETGEEVARITKTWEGLARTMFTTADNYVVQLHRQLEDPLRAMVVAAALSVDTALKQDDRGLA